MQVTRESGATVMATETGVGPPCAMTERAKITEFLKTELVAGPVAVRQLQEKAIAAGLLTEGDGPPLWKRKPWRRAAERLEVKHDQRDRGWFWRLPADKNLQVPDDAPQVPETLLQVPTISDASLSGAPSPRVEDIAAARRRFIEERLHWHETPEAHELMRAARESAERYLKTGDLKDTRWKIEDRVVC